MPPDRLHLQETRRQIARSIWLAMVNDEAPDDETLEREGYFDATDAVLAGEVVPRTEAEALAEALEKVTRMSWGTLGANSPQLVAEAALVEYRAGHPKSDTECDTSAPGGAITPREDTP